MVWLRILLRRAPTLAAAHLGLVRPVKSISSSSDRNDWLHHHIPHRIRAGLVGLSFASEFLPATADAALRTRFADACLQNAAFEGRMAAIRWLIEFIGVRDKQGKPARPHRRGDHDVGISSLPGGREVDLDSDEAEILCRAWKGCSQASSHATHDSKHFPVDATTLEEALRSIASHLDKTVYSASDEVVSTNLAEPRKPNQSTNLNRTSPHLNPLLERGEAVTQFGAFDRHTSLATFITVLT